jgi:hypothetical protein
MATFPHLTGPLKLTFVALKWHQDLGVWLFLTKVMAKKVSRYILGGRIISAHPVLG